MPGYYGSKKKYGKSGMSVKKFAVMMDKVAHPRSQYQKVWAPKVWGPLPAIGPANGQRVYGPNHVVGSGMYTGRGGFWGDMWKGTAGVRGAVGNWARSQGGVTGALGGLSGALGLGDYTTNAIVNDGQGAPEVVPSFSPNSGSTVVVSHKEYISDVYGTAAGTSFQNSSYPLNPGLQGTFPWLAQIAQNYDEYTIKQLIFTFRSSIAPIGSSGSGQVGTIIMATQYNAGEQPFTDKESMMQYDGSMSAKVIDGLISGVECDPAQMSGSYGKFTRAGPPPANQDVKTYDLGIFNIAVTNIPSAYENQSLGELWVSYTIELRKPKFFAALGFGIPRDTFLSQGAGGPTAQNFKTPLPMATITNVPATAYVPSVDVLNITGTPGYLMGQQNSLKVEIFSAPTHVSDSYTCFGLLFPSGLAGNYEITFRGSMRSVIAPGPLGPPQFLGGANIDTYGNVRMISDIPISADSAAFPLEWVSNIGSSTYGLGSVAPMPGQVSVTFTLHVAVAIATNGQDNFLTFNQPWQVNTYAGVPGSEYNNVQVDICEYNTGFNYKQGGQNDQIVYVNQGGQVEIPT